MSNPKTLLDKRTRFCSRHCFRPLRQRRLLFETLERREVLATFFVTTTADGGPGSLRQAILDANGNPGGDAIEFHIPASDSGFVDVDSHLPGGDANPDAYVIRLTANLPTFSDTSGGTIIDGRTQTTFGGDTNPFGPEIVIDGNARRVGLLFLTDVDNNAVMGLSLQRFSTSAIFFNESDGNWVAGNYVGTDATGTQASPNNAGITILKGSFNRIGTNSDGVEDAAEANLLSGNRSHGVRISGFAIGAPPAPATQNVIAGNLIGTDASGTVSLGTQFDGVVLDQAHGNVVGTNGDGVHDAAERNVISGNRLEGVDLAESMGNVVAGNYIGVDVTGTARVTGTQSTQRGVSINNAASANRIGTNADGLADEAERNVISGNAQYGIVMFTALTVEENVIAGNSIGVNVVGAPLGNGLEGIFMQGGVSDNIIGTNGDGLGDDLEGNVIAYNARAGIAVGLNGGDTATGRNSIRGNSIHDNAGLGIDLARDGVTLNDLGDGDVGPNGLQNFPLLHNAVSVAPVGTAVAGSLRSTPNTSFTIDFYASSAADPSGRGEGERWLGAINVTSNPAGIANFAGILPAATSGGEVLTATATDAAGNTSEFSQAIGIKQASTQLTLDAALALSVSDMVEMIGSEFATEAVIDPPFAELAFSWDISSLPASDAIVAVNAADLWANGNPGDVAELLELDLAIISDDLLEEIVG
jgi:hypothetical protein